jgi:hypothetical protein
MWCRGIFNGVIFLLNFVKILPTDLKVIAIEGDFDAIIFHSVASSVPKWPTSRLVR